MLKALLTTLFALFAVSSFAQADSPKAEAGHFRHVVMFKFKEGTSAEKVAEIEKHFGSLEEKIDTIVDYEWGHAIPESRGLDQGFTHCFVVTFKDKAGLEVYAPHQAHQDFIAVFKPHVEKVFVLDYVSK
ncbi:Dabb family protein [Roseibacillus persicicus]|uniref:Stress-response A/B barrel domain-containing protein n=1 Tax=Roseibacillus persicicus TaxID=454148 RepID=A0A918TY69_9BACT|nr:Dabb family protein [Roseibacillus persicicus]MDQ8189286.1 Dabb family protein [Roseibacillus persicicus]GHC65566.1 hypothetical protein GCM10007100_36710 [Roseibacillus persicicus]